MLKAFLSPDRICLEGNASSIEEGTRLCGELLVRSGCAESGYPDAMIETVHQLGDAIVMAPFTALPHAAPEMGGKRPAAAVLRLCDPIPIGGKNGPVRLILGFCGADSNSHMQVLSAIAHSLSQPGTIDRILRAGDAEEVINAIF